MSSSRFVPLSFAAACACGCGYESYNADLRENTVPYFEQRQDLDTNLSSPWERFGLSLRVPRGFDEVNPPPPPTNEELEDPDLEEPADPRQPDYLLSALPGLRGAFRGPQPGAGEVVGQRWVYVLDSRGLKDDPVDPGLPEEELPFAVADRFAAALNIPDTPEPTEFVPIKFPQAAKPFAVPVEYFKPATTMVGEFGDGVPHVVDLYVRRDGPRRTVIVQVMPEAAVIRDAAVGTARDLMLQTLETGKPAAAPRAGGGGAAGGANF